MAYGYRLFALHITPQRKPDLLHLDNPVFGQGGALAFLVSHISALKTQGGEADAKNSRYFRVKTAQVPPQTTPANSQGPWVIAITASGGDFGFSRDVVDTLSNSTKPSLATTDAVLEDLPMLLIVPPFGDTAYLVSGTRGRSHLTASLLGALNTRLKAQQLYMRIEANVADETAWNDFLNQNNVDVDAIELVQKHKPQNGTSFGDRSIAKAVLTLSIAKGANAKANILKELRAARKKNAAPKLVGVIGMQNAADDDDFDEQRVVYIQNGRKRRITVNSSWPAFIYDIGDTPIAVKDLLQNSQLEVAHLMAQVGTNRGPNWWPTEADLTTL